MLPGKGTGGMSRNEHSTDSIRDPRPATSKEPSWRDLMSSFESTDPTDFIHLGDDGVLRHFNESGAILNYAPLSPQQISQALSDTSSRDTAEDKGHFFQVFNGVDGRTVRAPALLYPPEELFPTKLPQQPKAIRYVRTSAI
ncbi:uncharacterized protein P174DRAFT_289479 [Aspergillus novofumigatus IBT 16806]|uniref:Uncharacterized protein n=1 Tax=Aspergillus novofumigatus (strain IBT 16806) TaxID=1392255 RepID=A0A2I1BXP5_ASPN1|nr:uncharacterized protein P174DRAFT_289479 [Aspergillus novofumigatus IBT 16806]PKX90129.1 hypothetical protein P174DRAFT_289479 [Aspergillus novofumigatus IBT 16806]